MKKLSLVLFLFGAVHALAAGDTTRVLFIGNSFTYVSDVPGLAKGFATAAGFPMKYLMHAPGGISVGDTAQGTEAHMNNPTVFSLIRSDNWDYVSLQDNQGRFVRGYGVFPDPAAYKVIEGHIKIKDSIKINHPCAHVLWFAGWAFKNGYPGIATTGKELIDNIYGNYNYLQDTAGEIISPIGMAWKTAIDSLPAVDLWGPDEAHQSLAGSYLTAAVIFTTIFRVHTEYIDFDGGLDSVTARTLRRIAWRTVIDSMAPTELATIVPDLVVTPTLLTASPGFTTYKWYRNGVSIGSGAGNTFSISADGCYQVVCADAAACESRSLEQCTDAVTLLHTVTPANGLRVYPSPATKDINIEIPVGQASTGAHLIICNAAGQVLHETELSEMNGIVNISLPDVSPGVYFVSVHTQYGIYRARFIKADAE